MAEEFTLPNVRAVAQAVAWYLKSHPDKKRPNRVIVGYDTRPLGDRFAQAVAEVFAGNGFEVLLTIKPTPTPAVSFAIRRLSLQGGIVVTASHNPFTYNGLKFKPSYAGPAEPEMTRWIEKRLFRAKAKQLSLEEGIKRKRIRPIDLDPSYLSFLKGYIRWDLVKKAHFKVGYDSMYGAGQDLLERVVAGSRIHIIPARKIRWPIESHHRPEPVGEHLGELSAAVRKNRCHVGLATDGDADRAGIVDDAGRFVSSQETMSLLLWHLLEDRKWRGLVATTVAGTNMMETIAQRYGVAFKRTPVGFKHIAYLIRTQNVLFGGEESGGFGFQGCVPERDGLLAGLLILEMMAMRRKKLSRLTEDLRKQFGRWTYARADLVVQRSIDPERLAQWAKGLSRSGSKLGPFAIREVVTLDGAKVIFEDNSWLLMRPSGTEPLLRVYAEAKSAAQLKALLRAGQQVGKQILT